MLRFPDHSIIISDWCLKKRYMRIRKILHVCNRSASMKKRKTSLRKRPKSCYYYFNFFNMFFEGFRFYLVHVAKFAGKLHRFHFCFVCLVSKLTMIPNTILTKTTFSIPGWKMRHFWQIYIEKKTKICQRSAWSKPRVLYGVWDHHWNNEKTFSTLHDFQSFLLRTLGKSE